MRKKSMILAAALFAAAVFLPADVMASGESRVYDYYDVLSVQEEAELNQELEEIYETYGFEAVILVSEDVDQDERMYAAEFMQDNHIGYGRENNGMCLFHQPDKRNIAVVFRGEAQEAFDTDIQDILLDDCTKYLKKDDPFGAYKVTISDLKGGLKRWSQGKSVRPMDVGGGILGFALIAFLFSVVVTAIPVLFMTLYQKGKMKTIRPQSNADAYIEKNGVHLDVERDLFVRTMTTRAALPKDDDHHSSGGSSGSFSSQGESFSGSSRSY